MLKLISIFILLFSFSFLNAQQTCDFKNIIKNNKFIFQPSYQKVYINGKEETRLNETRLLFPNCYFNNKLLYLYSYREDLSNMILIQFIFKTSNNSFQKFAENFIFKNNAIKTAIMSIKSSKKIIIEVSTNHNYEVRFQRGNRFNNDIHLLSGKHIMFKK